MIHLRKTDKPSRFKLCTCLVSELKEGRGDSNMLIPQNSWFLASGKMFFFKKRFIFRTKPNFYQRAVAPLKPVATYSSRWSISYRILRVNYMFETTTQTIWRLFWTLFAWKGYPNSLWETCWQWKKRESQKKYNFIYSSHFSASCVFFQECNGVTCLRTMAINHQKPLWGRSPWWEREGHKQWTREGLFWR